MSLDWRVLLVTIGITVGAGVFFGLARARFLAKSGSALASRTTAGPAPTIRRTLTVAEVTLAVVLLVGAGLLIRSFMNLTSVELGFARWHRHRPDVAAGHQRRERRCAAALLEQGLARIRELPGVTAVAVSNSIPIETGLNLAMTPPPGRSSSRCVRWTGAVPDYSRSFRIARAGTTFTDDHRAGRPCRRRQRSVRAHLFRSCGCDRTNDHLRQRGTPRDHRRRRRQAIGCRLRAPGSRWALGAAARQIYAVAQALAPPR